MSAENAKAMPTTRTARPTQSQVPQEERQRLPAADCHASQSRPSANTAKRTASCVRVSAAAAQAASAAAPRPQLGRTSVRAMSHSASVDRGYAIGSSTRIGE